MALYINFHSCSLQGLIIQNACTCMYMCMINIPDCQGQVFRNKIAISFRVLGVAIVMNSNALFVINLQLYLLWNNKLHYSYIE